MSEQAPEGVTAAEFADMRAGLNDLADSFAELRAAVTPKEKAEARADVDDSEADLEKMARTMGVSRAKLDESIAAAKKAERKDELLPIVQELLDELAAAATMTAATMTTATNEPAPKPARKPRAKANEPGAGDPPVPTPDSEPVKGHWSERNAAELLR